MTTPAEATRLIQAMKPKPKRGSDIIRGVVTAINPEAGHCSVRLAGENGSTPRIRWARGSKPIVGNGVELVRRGTSLFIFAIIDRTENELPEPDPDPDPTGGGTSLFPGTIVSFDPDAWTASVTIDLTEEDSETYDDVPCGHGVAVLTAGRQVLVAQTLDAEGTEDDEFEVVAARGPWSSADILCTDPGLP